MTEYASVGDRILGRKIICSAKDFSKQARISTRSRHNAQQTEAYGDAKIPAFAIVDIPLTHVGISLGKSGEVDSVKGEKLICQHENHPFINALGNGASRATFKGNPAMAFIDRELELVP